MKRLKRIMAIVLAGIMVASLIGCAGSGQSNSGGSKEVKFLYGGTSELMAIYAALIDEYNATEGKEQGITVKGVPKGTDLEGILAQQLSGNSGADVVALSDMYFKKFTPYFMELTDKIDQSVLDGIYENTAMRYFYDSEANTSNEDDPLYGVPIYNDAQVLYYNKTALKNNGVICISVAEEDLEAFNAGGKDANGKTKADYGIENVTVLNKGFYRSQSPFVQQKGKVDGTGWKALANGEVAIFNDQIAMNWDEMEDLAMINTASHNSKSVTTYGYYTQWWFDMGWSVGGDCVEDVSGNGDWVFTLATDMNNYQVNSGKTYTGKYTGTVYEEGDFLKVTDIIAAEAGDTIGYSTDKGTTYYYTVNGAKAGARDFSNEVTNGTLTEFPTILDAFSRFAYQAGKGGINVAPYPGEFSATSSVSYFISGKVAMLVERVSYLESVEKLMSDEWGIAPLVQYKEYTDPKNPNCDTASKEGNVAVCSYGYGLAVNAKTKATDASVDFLTWVATDGQAFLAENGYASYRYEDEKTMLSKLPYKNPGVVVRSLEYGKPNDHWYMPDNDWIDIWASPLNKEVRYGTLAFSDYIYQYIDETNEKLKTY